jgi:hypothetical protein
MKKMIPAAGLLLFCALSCGQRSSRAARESVVVATTPVTVAPTPPPAPAPERRPSRADIVLDKELLYDQHTLADTFPYNKGIRYFQFDKMRDRLFVLDSIQRETARWAVLQNNKNIHGQSPLVKKWANDRWHSPADMNGVERNQSVALYAAGETVPDYYGHDGSPVKLLGMNGDSTRLRIECFNVPGFWEVDAKYVKPIADGMVFTKAVMVDRTNQCIATVEKVGDRWLIRSMNPCSTGADIPPYDRPTPTGMFMVQEKKPKMFYTVDGSSVLAGYAPWASRFCNGGYLHGVPVNNPHGAIIEFSSTLGTIPRSHMCVRNASSHAKFMYDWAPVDEAVVFVYD